MKDEPGTTIKVSAPLLEREGAANALATDGTGIASQSTRWPVASSVLRHDRGVEVPQRKNRIEDIDVGR